MVRVLLADDHANVRRAFKRFLSLQADIQVVGEAEDGLRAVELAREFLLDVVLMDIERSGMDGIAATQLISAEHPNVRVIGFSDSAVKNTQMLAAGAVAYVPKPEWRGVLLAAIRGAKASA